MGDPAQDVAEPPRGSRRGPAYVDPHFPARLAQGMLLQRSSVEGDTRAPLGGVSRRGSAPGQHLLPRLCVLPPRGLSTPNSGWHHDAFPSVHLEASKPVTLSGAP